MLRQVAEFFVTHGSNVYMAALDAKYTFDRVHHLKLFNVLSDRKILFFIIKVIVNWYCKMFASVRWKGALSNMSPIKSGVLQGSIWSPSLFNVYVDVIIALPHIDVELVEMCVKHLQSGKAADADRLVAEHIVNAAPSLIIHLKLLFSLFSSNGYVPDSFSFGIIIPIVNDKSGDPSLLDNYRPIIL